MKFWKIGCLGRIDDKKRSDACLKHFKEDNSVSIGSGTRDVEIQRFSNEVNNGDIVVVYRKGVIELVGKFRGNSETKPKKLKVGKTIIWNKLYYRRPVKFFDNIIKEDIKSQTRYLFSLESEYGTHLKKDVVNTALREVFNKNKHPLSNNAKISKKNEERWEIVDTNSNYTIEDKDQKLNIYQTKYYALYKKLVRNATFFEIDDKKAITQLRSILRGQGIILPSTNSPENKTTSATENNRTRSTGLEFGESTKETAPKGGKSKIRRRVIDLGKTERANKQHEKIVSWLKEKLGRRGWRCGEGKGTIRCDLFAEKGRKAIVIEVKSVEENQLERIYKGIGQLYVYAYFLNLNKIKVTNKAIALGRKPDEDLLGCLESLHIGGVWLESSNKFGLSKVAKRQFGVDAL